MWSDDCGIDLRDAPDYCLKCGTALEEVYLDYRPWFHPKTGEPDPRARCERRCPNGGLLSWWHTRWIFGYYGYTGIMHAEMSIQRRAR